jgi:hypothetical protein
MPYCNLALKIKKSVASSNVLSTFAKEHFNANEAYPLDKKQFNIDGGLNDLRAIQQMELDTYGFFCRYEQDIQKTQGKILDFAKKHTSECVLVNFESVKN